MSEHILTSENQRKALQKISFDRAKTNLAFQALTKIGSEIEDEKNKQMLTVCSNLLFVTVQELLDLVESIALSIDLTVESEDKS